jgi:excinuclease ABC subunit B
MRRAIDETDRRRAIQRAYNEEHGITPQSILSKVDMGLAHILKSEYGEIEEEEMAALPEFRTQEELDAHIAKMETEMRESAKKFEFEKAARLRDAIKDLREKEFLFGIK